MSDKETGVGNRTSLVIAYHLLRDGTEYIELGGDYFEKRNKQQLERQLVKRLEQLGHKVVLEPAMPV
jgi:transposase